MALSQDQFNMMPKILTTDHHLIKLRLMTFSFFLFHFFMTFDSAFAQGLVKGRITGRNAEPLPFATIGILSRNAMTTSDLDGRFSILANPEDTLEIYYLGYYTAQIPVGTTTEFNITLRESTQQMDELVIVGYGSSRKKDLTGAASHINFDEFNGGHAFQSDDKASREGVRGSDIQ